MRHLALLMTAALAMAACGGSDSGADPDRFCEILDELDAQDTTGLPADEALPIIRDGRDKYLESVEVAPEEIKADVETFVDGVIKITDLLIAAGGDGSQIDSAALESVSDEAVNDGIEDAADRVMAWRASNCP